MTDQQREDEPKTARHLSRKELEAENERLRELLNARPMFEDSDWAVLINVDDDFRDRMAARAYIQAQGNEYAALRILGYKTQVDEETGKTEQGLTHEQLKRIARGLFLNDTVRSAVSQAVRKADDYKDAIVSRLVEQAVYGDDKVSGRAAMLLAKMNAGWLAPTKMQVQSSSVSFSAVLHDPDKMKQLSSYLEHEPGDATRIASEAAERVALPAGRDE